MSSRPLPCPSSLPGLPTPSHSTYPISAPAASLAFQKRRGPNLRMALQVVVRFTTLTSTALPSGLGGSAGLGLESAASAAFARSLLLRIDTHVVVSNESGFALQMFQLPAPALPAPSAGAGRPPAALSRASVGASTLPPRPPHGTGSLAARSHASVANAATSTNVLSGGGGGGGGAAAPVCEAACVIAADGVPVPAAWGAGRALHVMALGLAGGCELHSEPFRCGASESVGWPCGGRRFRAMLEGGSWMQYQTWNDSMARFLLALSKYANNDVLSGSQL
eukprot:354874-Chlamydomonas_euryale.AAC.6